MSTRPMETKGTLEREPLDLRRFESRPNSTLPLAIRSWLTPSRGVVPSTDKNSLHERDGIYYLSCFGYDATSRSLHGPYVHRGLVGTGWGLDTPYAHGDFFRWRGDWYHVWCRYRDRSHDRIRDSFIAPVVYDDDGAMRTDLSALDGHR